MPDLTDAVRTLARLSRILERSCDDLTLPQYRLLALVVEGDERASRLASRLALAKPTITAAVDALVERGLLVRRDVASDRRAHQLCLTPAGRRALKAAEEAMAARVAPLFDRLADKQAALDALHDIDAALDEAARERVTQ